MSAPLITKCNRLFCTHRSSRCDDFKRGSYFWCELNFRLLIPLSDWTKLSYRSNKPASPPPHHHHRLHLTVRGGGGGYFFIYLVGSMPSPFHLVTFFIGFFSFKFVPRWSLMISLSFARPVSSLVGYQWESCSLIFHCPSVQGQTPWLQGTRARIDLNEICLHYNVQTGICYCQFNLISLGNVNGNLQCL